MHADTIFALLLVIPGDVIGKPEHTKNGICIHLRASAVHSFRFPLRVAVEIVAMVTAHECLDCHPLVAEPE